MTVLIKKIETEENGTIIVELEKDDCGAHRFSIAPGDDFAGKILPAVNANLSSPIADTDVGKIISAIKSTQTTEVVSAYQAPLIAAAKEAAHPENVLARMKNLRAAAYRSESDPLGMRALRLEMAGDPGAAQAKADYLDKVVEIEKRFPDAPSNKE